MANPLEGIEKQVRRRNFDSPPLHLWHPALSGDIPIRIAADGTWYHEGAVIARDALVRLFASILRREDDGEYYLVTPAEKWRIAVDLHPLIVTDVSLPKEGGELLATLNTGRHVHINAQHPLFPEPAVDGIPAIQLEHGLSAMLNRAAWYRLADMAREEGGELLLSSGGYQYRLGSPG